jgi:hypothetical protein
MQAAPDWLDVSTILPLFDPVTTTAHARYRGFVAEGIQQPSPWNQLSGQIFLGVQPFSIGRQPLPCYGISSKPRMVD